MLKMAMLDRAKAVLVFGTQVERPKPYTQDLATVKARSLSPDAPQLSRVL